MIEYYQFRLDGLFLIGELCEKVSIAPKECLLLLCQVNRTVTGVESAVADPLDDRIWCVMNKALYHFGVFLNLDKLKISANYFRLALSNTYTR